MINPIKLLSLKDKFFVKHPKVIKFFDVMIKEGVQEGSVLELYLKKPDGTVRKTNMRVTKEDLEMLEEFSKLKF